MIEYPTALEIQSDSKHEERAISAATVEMVSSIANAPGPRHLYVYAAIEAALLLCDNESSYVREVLEETILNDWMERHSNESKH